MPLSPFCDSFNSAASDHYSITILIETEAFGAFMLASRIGATTFPSIMADDSMEISSEHGRDAGGEDIDIDIDLTAGQVDEDYVLEDAASNAGLGDDFHPQPSTAVANDDLMIDEDEESYAMDDADLIADEPEENMDHEEVAIPVTVADLSHFDGNEHTNSMNFAANGSKIEADLSWEQHQISEHGVDETDVQVRYSEVLLQKEGAEDEEKLDVSNTQEDRSPKKTQSEDVFRTATPRDRSPGGIAVEEPRSPPLSQTGNSTVPPAHQSDDVDSNPNTTASGDSNEIATSAVLDDTLDLPIFHDVIVVYRSVEYALFGTSDSDDPDSFFLSDLSIAQKPLSDFFKAIREVIHEDLAHDDELCISFEDLGLETEEVSCAKYYATEPRLTFDQTVASIEDATLTQILQLHEKLLQNDEVEEHKPLRFLLGTRPSFSTRLANLIAGAADGKGLSELVTWDEESERFDETGEVLDRAHEDEPSEGNPLPNEDSSGDNEVLGIEGSESTAIRPPSPQSDEQEQVPHEEADNGRDAGHSDSEPTEEPAAGDARSLDNQELSKNKPVASGEDEEEDDLIDYSDEEALDSGQQEGDESHVARQTNDNRRSNGIYTDFISPCLKPNTCFCSKCSDLLAEYEAINEELRRRSISRAAEENTEKGDESNLAASGEHANGDTDQQRGAEEENGIWYDETNDEGFEHVDADLQHHDLTGDDIDAAAGLDQHDVEAVIDDVFDENGGITDDRPTTDSRNETGDEGEFNDEHAHALVADEPDLGEDETSHDLSNPKGETTYGSNGVIAAVDLDDHQEEASFSANSLGFADVADSSATVSADEIRYEGLDEEVFEDHETNDEPHSSTVGTDNSANVDHGDEIDYEDDEDDKERNSSGEGNVLPPVNELTTTNGNSGKRSRADADPDDTSSVRSKGLFSVHLQNIMSLTNRPDAKRRRS